MSTPMRNPQTPTRCIREDDLSAEMNADAPLKKDNTAVRPLTRRFANIEMRRCVAWVHENVIEDAGQGGNPGLNQLGSAVPANNGGTK